MKKILIPTMIISSMNLFGQKEIFTDFFYEPPKRIYKKDLEKEPFHLRIQSKEKISISLEILNPQTQKIIAQWTSEGKFKKEAYKKVHLNQKDSLFKGGTYNLKLTTKLNGFVIQKEQRKVHISLLPIK